MPLITDPDYLNQGVELTLDTTALTITLTTTGNLSDDGVTGQALYSFLKEEWRTDDSLIKYAPPFNQMITPEQFEFVNGWKLVNDTSRNLIRSCGWREIDASNTLNREYMNIITLSGGNDIDLTDTADYAFSSSASKLSFAFPGNVNEAIQTYGDATNGSFDNRSDSLTTYIRIQGKIYGSSTSGSIGLTGLNYIANRFPLASSIDGKITASDATIAANAPYSGMSITYGAVTRSIGGVARNFGVVVDGNNGTKEQIYEFVQYSLRQAGDIDDGAGTQVGQLADSLMGFVGDTLVTQNCFIDNFDSNDTNSLTFTDTGGEPRTFPFVAAGTLSFNANLVSDANAIYRVFFSSGFGTGSALIVNDNSGNPISGTIGGNATIPFDFDYDGSTQGGRTAGTDAAVTVVAIGLDSAQYVSATATISRATGQNISLVAPFERNYSNVGPVPLLGAVTVSDITAPSDYVSASASGGIEFGRQGTDQLQVGQFEITTEIGKQYQATFTAGMVNTPPVGGYWAMRMYVCADDPSVVLDANNVQANSIQDSRTISTGSGLMPLNNWSVQRDADYTAPFQSNTVYFTATTTTTIIACYDYLSNGVGAPIYPWDIVSIDVIEEDLSPSTEILGAVTVADLRDMYNVARYVNGGIRYKAAEATKTELCEIEIETVIGQRYACSLTATLLDTAPSPTAIFGTVVPLSDSDGTLTTSTVWAVNIQDNGAGGSVQWLLDATASGTTVTTNTVYFVATETTSVIGFYGNNNDYGWNVTDIDIIEADL